MREARREEHIKFDANKGCISDFKKCSKAWKKTNKMSRIKISEWINTNYKFLAS